MKIKVLGEVFSGPWGGGNQFLKALKKEANRKGLYTSVPEEAEVLLFNSHHSFTEAMNLKEKYPEKIFIHRVDGPMNYRGKRGEKLDKKIFFLNSLIADGTIFQSQWSLEETKKNHLVFSDLFTVIHNAPDPEIFFREKKNLKDFQHRKIKLVAVSWSTNPRKGFDIYHLLDEKLDFSIYEMSFVGNVDFPFRNIKMIHPMDSKTLGNFLRTQDIFVFPSLQEACSNSLLEAIHCGLPTIVRKASSNQEVMNNNGLLFDDLDVIEKIDTLKTNFFKFYENLNITNIAEVYSKYHNFFKKVKQDRIYKPSRVNTLKRLQLKLGIL